jgi:peroxiredoxin
LAAVVVLTSCSTTTATNPDSSQAAEQIGITRIASSPRVPAPTISGTTLQGAHLDLAAYRGDVTVLNVWGSWCTECRTEAAALEETYQKYRVKGVRFLGINTRDENAAALAYYNTFDVTYPSLQDPDEALLLQFKAILPATNVPSTAIIDRTGKVAVRILGSATAPQLDEQLDFVLGGH